MMAAGHPRIAFELDLFSTLQQHHDDGRRLRRAQGPAEQRADCGRSARRGGAPLARPVRRPGRGSEGVFPEFYFYDCHSCHRQITDGPSAGRARSPIRGGRSRSGMPPYNDENMIMLSAAARVLAPGQAGAFERGSREFHARWARGRRQAVAAAGRLRATAGALSDAFAGGDVRPRRDLRDDRHDRRPARSAPRFTDYAGSAQAVMAVDTLLNALVREGAVTVGAAAAIRARHQPAYARCATPTLTTRRLPRRASAGAAPQRSEGCGEACAGSVALAALAARGLRRRRRRRQ